MSPYAAIFRELSSPLKPQPTGAEPRLVRRPGVQAVLFDIYGTLLISGSGEVGTAGIGTTGPVDRAAAAVDAFAAIGQPLAVSGAEVERVLVDTIAEHHRRAKSQNISHPEVVIIEVWRDTCRQLGIGQAGSAPLDWARLAVEFEARANPVWPMPDLEACLAELKNRSIALGLISNAQFFTPELFPALVGKTLDELGFDPHLRYYSYEHHHAKPSDRMYRLAANTLESRGIPPDRVICVGNDMRNDVLPAAGVGFATILFAGDARSLRLRAGDPQTAGLEPDAVVTELMQIVEVV